MIEQINQGFSFTSDEFYHQLRGKYSNWKLFTFVGDQKTSSYLTGSLLMKKIVAMSARLQACLQSQEKVVVILPQGEDYIYCILACMHANVTAVPTAITSMQEGTKMPEKLLPIVEDSKASCFITNSYFQNLLEADSQFENLIIINVDEAGNDNQIEVNRREHTKEDIALLLYTSGSTSNPKGVMLTHENVVSQAVTGARQWHMSKESSIVSWMPQFHNFGLYFDYLAPLSVGAHSVIMPPDSFVGSPELWFQTMGSFHCTHTAAPNFAFDYCCNAIDMTLLQGVSLHTVQAIVSGGEPIRKETYEAFVEKFQYFGIKKEVFCPHYGMSEAGSITTKTPGESVRFLALSRAALEMGQMVEAKEEEDCKYVTSCGEIAPEVKVKLVNLQTGLQSAENEVGEIWIKGPSIAVGYFNCTREDEDVFVTEKEDVSTSCFFRTGDIGFIKDNHLYIIGREKEVIIIYGKNYHPVDLEWTIKKYMPELTLPLSVFSKEEDGQETIIVVLEVEENQKETYYRQLLQQIRECISQVYALDVTVVLTAEGNIPKTGSGKIQRRKCKNLYLKQELPFFEPYRKEGEVVLTEAPDQVSKQQEKDMISLLIHEVFSKILSIEANALKGASTFGELGFNSIRYVQVSKKIEQVLQIPFAPVMLFKHRSIEKLAQYLSTQTQLPPDKKIALEMATDVETMTEASMEGKSTISKSVEETDSQNVYKLSNASNDETVKAEPLTDEIAIIGISCNFPGDASNPEAFWNQLVKEKDCITTVGESRPQIIEDAKNSYGKNSGNFPNWGGFIHDVDQFDAAFFGISPLEAESMDPQQRKILELTWSVIEDSGYDPQKLADSPVGLFMGVHNNDYAELIAKQPKLMDIYGAYLDSGLHMSMTTHRASRWFNFHGPSEVINTACSSSLVALHHAVEAIHKKECTMAIAGGINLILSSRIYTASHKAGMLSADGRCKTFDESADGFVRAEGYGAVLLKPLSKARQDHDHIYGVLKGTAVNHDGQSNSLRAPNLNAQKELLLAAYQRSGVPVESISYIEAHGTGTSLGDPIEFQALKEAFEELEVSHTEGFCGLGTVKTNIGHTESAAGVAGLIKVLLSMQHKTLPGILHFKQPNQYLTLEGSSFYIVDSTREWKSPMDVNGQMKKRRAGISSFGYGGANAHIIVEEYIQSVPKQNPVEEKCGVFIPLSAKSKEQLFIRVRQLADFLNALQGKSISLRSLSYTLQTGRSHMEERLILHVKDLEELKEKLEKVLKEQEDILNRGHVNRQESSGIWFGSVKQNSHNDLLIDAKNQREQVKQWVSSQQLESVAKYYVQGGTISWDAFYDTEVPERMSLPTYPFAKNQYWIPKDAPCDYVPSSYEIHPLLHRNTSSFLEQRFCTVFTGTEPFLEDHIIRGQKIVPGVIQLEMVRAAFEKAIDNFELSNFTIIIKEIVWSKPICIEQKEVEVQVGLFIDDEEQISFELYSDTDGEEIIRYSYGQIEICEKQEEVLPLVERKETCQLKCITKEEIYSRFQEQGIQYGKSHQAIEKVWVGEHTALVKLSLLLADTAYFNQFVIHPGITDSALQTITALQGNEDKRMFLPYSVSKVEIIHTCSQSMWAWIEAVDSEEENDKIHRYQICICDEEGNVCMKWKGLIMAAVDQNYGSSSLGEGYQTLVYAPVWQKQSAVADIWKEKYGQRVILLVDPLQVIAEECMQSFDNCFILRSASLVIEENYYDFAAEVLKQLQQMMKSQLNALIQMVVAEDNSNCLYCGLEGMLKTAELENPALTVQLIRVEQWEDTLPKILDENAGCQESVSVSYHQGIRYQKEWCRLEGDQKEALPWKDGGVYLITGGMGGLGILFAKEIAHKTQCATIFLIGRSEADDRIKKQLRELEELGVKVFYETVNISKKQEVSVLIQNIRTKYSTLNGIIHAAGIIQDSYILKKSKEELKEVMQPKVGGVLNLDEESWDLKLDFFILCSSIAGCLGNAGQSDYSAANAFMDEYAAYREKLVEAGVRYGRTLSINWPLWEDGGMQVDAAVKALMRKNMGMVPMTSQNGMKALYQSFASCKTQVLVMEGIEDKIHAFLTQKEILERSDKQKKEKTFKQNRLESEASINQSCVIIEECVLSYFKELLSSVLRLPAQNINENAPMEQYGIDSILIMQLTDRLEQIFGSLPKTLFFEYQSIRELTEYFMKSFPAKLNDLLGIQEKDAKKVNCDGALSNETDADYEDCNNTTNRMKGQANSLIGKERSKWDRFFRLNRKQKEENTGLQEEIAIIGLAGKYPGADNTEEFWEVLREGKDCITEIPKERWDYSQYFDENKNAVGKTYTKWGGFINGVDEFDPLYFNISPKEAQLMDPQERLFLQCVHSAIEDAGYSKESIGETKHRNRDRNLDKNQDNNQDRKVGVFVGVMFEEYQLYGAQTQLQENPIALSGSIASIANRVSYFYNLHGPSMAVDTMCSSSLTALHLACESLQNKSCQVAIAGGVNVSIHPNKFLLLAQGKFASSKGRCESFGEGGDGYVPGEGVGAVLLKPLSKAVEDGDAIYGVIKATAINHGGKRNGYTVPNPNAQADVIHEALRKAAISARSINYIEAHGTGTALGDPIEIAGLTKAFRNNTEENQFCFIGSAKSNIGHCESAAGMAGLTKILLQLKHKQFAPSLHSEILNTNIDFTQTPFTVLHELTDWNQTVGIENGRKVEYPRRAGLSAFGAGGSNAHVILEEYIPIVESEKKKIQSPVIVVLSAKNEKKLTQQVENLYHVLQLHNLNENELENIAYTLQTGRSALEERLAILASSIQELKDKLLQYLEKKSGGNDCYRGSVKQDSKYEFLLDQDEDIRAAIQEWIKKKKYEKLSKSWVSGMYVDWELFYETDRSRRIHLPSYPFAKERYWFCENHEMKIGKQEFFGHDVIHPLLHRNCSTLKEQKFTSSFSGDEFFLKYHKVQGQKVLPGAVYLEMIHKGIQESMPGVRENSVQLKNLVWQSPFTHNTGVQKIILHLTAEAVNRLCYEISSNSDKEPRIMHCQGSAELLNTQEGITQKLNIEKWKEECQEQTISRQDCYERFQAVGIEYGSGHQGIEHIWLGKDKLLARLVLPKTAKEQAEEYILHPAMLDSAIQTAIGFTFSEKEEDFLSLPYALETLQIRKKYSKSMWAVVRRTEGSTAGDPITKLDMDLCEEDGEIAIRIQGLSFRPFGGSKREKTHGTILLRPIWQSVDSLHATEEVTCAQREVIVCEPSTQLVTEELKAVLKTDNCEIFYSDKKDLAVRYEQYCHRLFLKIKQLLQNNGQEKILIQLVFFEEQEKELFAGLSGLLKTAALENPRLLFQVIRYQSNENVVEIVKTLEECQYFLRNKEIRYEHGKYKVRALTETTLEESLQKEPLWKQGGVYFITGGAGGLGLILAEDIVKKVKDVTLILTGRSSLDEEKMAKLEELRKTGARVEYRQSDISDKEQVQGLLAEIVGVYGSLNGVIHSAGRIRDHYLLHKTEEEVNDVLKPKVRGLINLNEAVMEQKLDFILLFSSQAGETGNPGQADYAAANAFMDAYASYRNQLAKQGKCFGKTVSINWPLWEMGGMHIDEEMEKRMYENTGMIPLRAETGLKVVYQALAGNEERIMPVEGKVEKLREVFITQGGKKTAYQKERVQEGQEENYDRVESPDQEERTMEEIVLSQTSGEAEDLREKVLLYFKKLLSTVTKLSMKQIETDASLEKYGIDSLMIMQMTDELEKNFGSLSKTLFFEYQSIDQVADYFIEVHKDKLMELLKMNHKETLNVPIFSEKQAETQVEEWPKYTLKSDVFSKMEKDIETPDLWTEEEKPETESIAIIGVAGRYPQADNLEGLWENLCEGKDCITTIPNERWDYLKYGENGADKTGRTYGKWGGFIKDVDKFDPLFFHISPHEAELMDPQERLFLECSIHVLEDAGYTREALSKYEKGELARSVGVFAGVMYEEYQLYGAQEQKEGHMVAVNGISSSVANRVSYFCNFHGPSISLNTMCSSSLAAIHMACQSIQHKECSLAIAGGVNVSLHPNKYLLLSQSNFLSSKGKCESFGQGGDGYVPGEGVGAVLLKPLSQAIRDKDHIYGVIKGSAMNHGGKTNGYTVPNPAAQTGLIKEALKQSKIDARNISYIEAHGTGTALGDPIEITALSKVFEEQTKERQFCAIGSIKSNIGHLESAAGIAGVTKILLQMKYKKLVPSLHSEVFNPNIDFERTPFKVQHKLEDWNRPVQRKDNEQREYPRIAGISAFGAGGTNVHLMLEEYIPDQKEELYPVVTMETPFMIVLSAKTEDRLHQRALQLLNVLEKEVFLNKELLNIAYTLQTGREEMESRLGILTTSIEDLKEKLKQYLAGMEDMEELYIGNARLEKDTLTVWKVDEELKNAIQIWMQKKKYSRLLSFWVKGMAIQWESMYQGERPYKISLPAYPFERERYWVPQTGKVILHTSETVSQADEAISQVNETIALEDQSMMQASEDSLQVNQIVLQNSIAPKHSLTKTQTEVKQAEKSETQRYQRKLKAGTIQYLKTLLTHISQVPFDRIEANRALEDYGIDSVMIKQFTAQLEKSFSTIEMTLFFEYQNLEELAGYLIRQYEEQLVTLLALDKETAVLETQNYEITFHENHQNNMQHNEAPKSENQQLANQRDKFRSGPREKQEADFNLCADMDIAVIGLSGRYPMAENVNKYWENLKAGKDCITEIPKERWDYARYYEKDQSKAGTIGSKWGGFIDGADQFDPMFFHILPEDAKLMDPQERLFLECVYETLEDAGYTREALSKDKELGINGEVGVFVGVTFSEYQLYGVENQMKGNPMAISGITSSIANRVSYFCNFNGPSLAIDSMCSSSLSALSVACDSIKQGRCQLAVAGGVNLSLHPNKYLFLSQFHFLSSKGRCESFGEGGDGYVPGEGVGAVLLKPLSKAEEDGDHIYGIIKATAVNHGGKTNGYSVPNLNAQADVIRKAFERAKINPRQINYIEAHGTGTSLGDPIEIAGITRAFEAYTADRDFCAIGSAKSNIGHLEAAAGIAGITKVLLQMKHKMLVPSLHAEVLNSNIDFSKTPFHVQKTLQEWKPVTTINQGEEMPLPRMAGVSSFGAGGANVHVILQEYTQKGKTQVTALQETSFAVILSAKTQEVLKKQARQLLEAVVSQKLADQDLQKLCFTLQTGREAMEERLGMFVTSMQKLQELLQGYIEGKKNLSGLYYSREQRQKKLLSLFQENEEFKELSAQWMQQENYDMLLNLWVAGVDMDWKQLYTKHQPERISFPTYPFDRKRYWFSDREEDGISELRGEENRATYLSFDEEAKEDADRQIETGELAKDTMFWYPVWQELKEETARNTYYEQRVIILCESQIEYDIIEPSKQERSERKDEVKWLVLHCSEIDYAVRYSSYANQIFLLIKEILQKKPKGKVLLQLVIFEEEEKEIYRGLGAILKTAIQENPKLVYQLVQLNKADISNQFIQILEDSQNYLKNTELRWDKGHYFKRSYEEAKLRKHNQVKIPWKQGGIYVITGGMGGLGILFAEEIIQKVKNVTLLLIGRSKLDASRQEKLLKFNHTGAIVKYLAFDISDKVQVQRFVEEVRRDYGRINGVIHSAGITKDNFLLHKTETEFTEVLRPKVTGLLALDEAVAEEPLDFFLLFSSGVAEFGNPGQADYAAANAFMDAYTAYRNKLVENNERRGKTYCVNWPLWKNGGMRVDKELQKVMFESKGLIPMDNETGIQALYEILSENKSQTILTVGDQARIRRAVLALEQEADTESVFAENSLSSEDLLPAVLDKLTDLFKETMKLQQESINREETFEDYGIDSVKLTVLSQKIAPYFKNLSNTIFFEYRTLAELGEYLTMEYPADCMKWIQKAGDLVFSKGKNIPLSENKREQVNITEEKTEDLASKREPIAIIGVSGRFPSAKNIEEFWEILRKGQSCVTEIPKDRWSMEGFYEADREQAVRNKKSFSKWGGFIEDFAAFDPLFFNISPAEAERMDPQERLFLEECWKAFEDAGYVTSQMDEGVRSRIGVFGGITKTGFDLWNHTSNQFYSTSFSGMVNRLSYFMDFSGPSMAVDTMCSSSLAAIHQACENLWNGELFMAVVGAVNLYLHPSNYTSLSQAGLISDSPNNSVFGKGGNGFIPSEGAGAIVLKRLSDAQRDRDAIWGVIRGSALLHSGKTNGYHVPNPAKQAAVIEKALQSAKIQPSTIRHIEAAASGSEMIDSIEMTAISKVFQACRNKDRSFYTLGSVKAVFGHGEAVSGMTQLIKALLQLQKKMICPTHLPEHLNLNINFDTLPFKIQTELTEWKNMEQDGIKIPRRIGINSFGAGGVYAHVILEEYVDQMNSFLPENTNESCLFVFSAKTSQVLNHLLAVWKEYLEKHPEINRKQLSYILQTKREPMKYRFATIACQTEELIQNLKDYLAGSQNQRNFDAKSTYDSNRSGDAFRKTGNLDESELFVYANAWVHVSPVDWKALYDNEVYRHIPQLPTYPFKKKKFWISNQEEGMSKDLTAEDITSNLDEESFLSVEELLDLCKLEAATTSQPVSMYSNQEEETAFISLETDFGEAFTDKLPNKNEGNEGKDQKKTRQILQKHLFDLLYLDESDEIDDEADFMELGLDSLSISRFIQSVNQQFKLDMRETILFDYPNITLLADYIITQMKERG